MKAFAFAAALFLLADARPSPSGTGKAIYFLTNERENKIVAIPIAGNGKLSAGSVTNTKGAGGNSVDAMNVPAMPDPLASQSALTIAGKFVFAVNAGSNTLSMLSISEQDATKLTLIGEPVPLPGEFPNTVAASQKNKLVCVGMTGAKAGIACSSFSKAGLGKMDQLRPFDIGQTTPPQGPANTVSHAFFSQDESRLFTTVKGNPAMNQTGFFSVFDVTNKSRCSGAARLSTKETRSSPAGTAVLFGSAPIPNTSNVFVTDASFGGAVLSLDSRDNKAKLLMKQAVPDQKATCWVALSAATESAFVTDVAAPRLVEMSIKDARIISTIDLSATGSQGLIDLRAAGNFVYALSPGHDNTAPAVEVVDVSGGQGFGKLLQHFELTKMVGAGLNVQGMAVLL